jgi:hypothetical protein
MARWPASHVPLRPLRSDEVIAMNNSIPSHGVQGNDADPRSQTPQPAGDRGYQSFLIWSAAAERLVEWASHLVNRTDAWGAYTHPRYRIDGRTNSYTAPAQDQRVEGALTDEVLFRHFCGATQGDLVGLHAIGRANTSRWLVVDIDKHADDDGASPEANFGAAIEWWQCLRTLGFAPLLLDSNGAGGFHVLQLFEEPIAATIVHSFAQWLVRDYGQRGLCRPPETFPRQPCLTEDRKYGNFWRLPGRHHTRDHWSKVWDGIQWVEGNAAIEALIGTHGDPAQLIPGDAKTWIARNDQIGTPGAIKGQCTSGQDDTWANILSGVEAGERHTVLTRLAGHFFGHGLSPTEIEELCVLWNARNRPPLPDAEVRSTVQDIALRHEQHRSRHSQQRTILRLQS